MEIAEKGAIVQRLQEKTMKISNMLMALQLHEKNASAGAAHGEPAANGGGSCATLSRSQRNRDKRASLREAYKVSDVDFDWEKAKRVREEQRREEESKEELRQCEELRKQAEEEEGKKSGETEYQSKNVEGEEDRSDSSQPHSRDGSPNPINPSGADIQVPNTNEE